MRKAMISAAAAVLMGFAGPALAAGGVEIPKREWSFQGIFGTYDRAAMQRGLQIYKEVCAGCHSLNQIYFGNLTDLGYAEAQVKAFAAEYEVQDGPNDEGEMYTRPALPSDRFVKPFPNDNAARAGNNGALPPDLSLMVEARIGGPNYLYALLTGYGEPPAGQDLMEGMSYNNYFPGHQIAMPNMLFDGSVVYTDGTEATVEQIAWDVTNFLAWASEPNLEARLETGRGVILYLLIFAGLLYAVKRKIWAKVH